MKNDLGLTHASYRLHSATLKQLQTAVRDNKRMLSHETIASIMLLGLYEVNDFLFSFFSKIGPSVHIDLTSIIIRFLKVLIKPASAGPVTCRLHPVFSNCEVPTSVTQISAAHYF